MMSLYTYIEMAKLYREMEGVLRFKELGTFVPGYFPFMNDIVLLKDCYRENEEFICGYSTILNRMVRLEMEALCPAVSLGTIKAFLDADHMDFKKYIIVADYTKSDFHVHYPYASRYLQECFEQDNSQTRSLSTKFIRDSLREVMYEPKLLFSALGNRCRAMVDINSHVISSVGTYTCHFYNCDIRQYRAYAAIFNSKLFSYCFYQEYTTAKIEGTGRNVVMRNLLFPHPDKQEGYTILSNLAECLMYLTRPYLPQISPTIPNDRLQMYMTEIMDMVVYEMYFPTYMKVHNLDVISHMLTAPFMIEMAPEDSRIYETYLWYQRSDNAVRQKMDLLDSRSPEMLYPIHIFKPYEQDKLYTNK